MNVMIFRFRNCEEYCYASSDSIWVEKRFCRNRNGSNILSSPAEVEEWCVYSKLFSKVEHPNVGWRMGLLVLILIVAVSWENVSCVSKLWIHRPRTFHAKSCTSSCSVSKEDKMRCRGEWWKMRGGLSDWLDEVVTKTIWEKMRKNITCLFIIV